MENNFNNGYNGTPSVPFNAKPNQQNVPNEEKPVEAYEPLENQQVPQRAVHEVGFEQNTSATEPEFVQSGSDISSPKDVKNFQPKNPFAAKPKDDLSIDDLKYDSRRHTLPEPPENFGQKPTVKPVQPAFNAPEQQNDFAVSQNCNPNGEYHNHPEYQSGHVTAECESNRFDAATANAFQPQNNVKLVPKPEKKGSAKGLVAVILVLSFLLLASVGGIVYFILNDYGKEQAREDNLYGSFSDSLPKAGGSKQNSVSENHKESDYSDKADPDYKGMNLKDKPKDADSDDYTSEKAFSKASPSVVGIVCYQNEKGDSENGSSQGSGIILSSDGYVITNSHVIGNSKTAYAIEVVTSEGKKYNAGVVGFDSRTDIAVLKMDDASDLTAATFGDSEKVEQGEDILVIGNPGGLDFQNSMTKGIVSAVDRSFSTKSIAKYIQTDAAINPGNSGGPIVNKYGQVIGIATSKIAMTNYEGMGFAIPTEIAKSIVDSLVKNGYVEGRVKLGISGSAITAEANGEKVSGILVDSITSDGPCDGTALKEGDLITEVDGTKVKTFAEVYQILEKHKEGDTIKVKFLNGTPDDSGKYKSYEIELTLQADK